MSIFVGGPRDGERVEIMEDGTRPEEIIVAEAEYTSSGEEVARRSHLYTPNAFGVFIYQGETTT